MMDTLPRVPDVNGVLDEKLYSDLYTRTSWVDASVALDQIEKVSTAFLFYPISSGEGRTESPGSRREWWGGEA